MAEVKKITKVVKKKAEKTAAKVSVKKTETKVIQVETTVNKSLTVPVVDVTGKKIGQITLPEKLFGVKVNPQLLAQSVRVHLANQRQGNASTKTRGEVEGSTRKIYRQKGTGRARHGSIRAPIFVGGGIVFGPKPHSFKLKLTESMRRLALASALSNQLQAGRIIVVEGLTDIEPKTKNMASALTAFEVTGRTLLVTGSARDNAVRAGRNLADLTIMPAQNLNSYEVLLPKKLVLMKEAVSVLEKTFIK